MSAVLHAIEDSNPHFLGSVLDASARRSIVASRDIVDEQGTKLWAGGQPVSQSLRERLLERKLRHPLESCLRAADGVTTVHLVEALQALLAEDSPLATLLRPHHDGLIAEVRQLPLHAAVQLMLTVTEATRPDVFRHAIRGMALAGAMALWASFDRMSLRLAMLGGLLHDVGEMYLDPRYLDPAEDLDEAGFRHVAVHPAIGGELLRRLTDYPAVLAKGVAEHHERGDGTGYPARSAGGQGGALGRLLAVVELALGRVGDRPDDVARLAFSLRFVPGEFSARWIAFIMQSMAQDPEATAAQVIEAAEREAELSARAARLEAALQRAQRLAFAAGAPTVVREISGQLAHRLARLQIAGHAMGLWTPCPDDSPEVAAERAFGLDELRFRMDRARRDCHWTHAHLAHAEAQMLESLWHLLANDRAEADGPADTDTGADHATGHPADRPADAAPVGGSGPAA